MSFVNAERVKKIVEKEGMSFSKKEVEGYLSDLGIKEEDFVIPLDTRESLYVDPSFTDNEELFGIEDIEEPDEQFVFDSNRLCTIWKKEKFVLLYVSSDGKAEEAWYLFNL